MKKILLLSFMLLTSYAYSQIPSFNQAIIINSTFIADTIINPFNNSNVSGIGLSGDIVFNSDTSFVRIIVGNEFNQYMVYETYPMLETDNVFNFDYECEESCFFDNFQPTDLILQVSDASVYIENIDWSNSANSNPLYLRNMAKRNRNIEKLLAVENYIEENNLIWIAEETQFSKLYYSDKAKAWGKDYKSFGFEFYARGFYSVFGPTMISTTNYDYVDNFDWRNRHGANSEYSPYYDGDVEGTGWITPVVCQGYGCWIDNEFICNTSPSECDALGGIYREAPTCWVFGPTAHIESLTNLFYNDHIDIDLSEQYVICDKGLLGPWMVSSTLNLYKTNGVPSEDCLPYSASLENCNDICDSPSERIWIDDYSYNRNPSDEEIREYLMDYGPVTAELIYYPWGTAGHSMALVGWGVIDEDALSVDGIENPIHSSWYGTTYWIFKESSGPGVHHNGFKYIIDWENNSNIYTIDPHITSLNRNDEDVNCFDKDGDGYYFWGIGPKPDHCPPCPDIPDGDDSNPGLGPINEYGVCSIIDSYTASFEKGWDNWVQIDEDDQDWWRHQGPTETPNTGPSNAQDGDFYIYTESSCNGCYPHKKYIVESPPINLEKYCEGQVEFYYHMNTYLWGSPDYSKLELQVSFNDGLSWSTNYWSVMHNQGNEWHLVKVNFPANVNKIRFVAITGDYSFSDIALDNITIGPTQKDEQPIIINSNITWNDDDEINSDVIIENGAVLTINDCNISMHEQARIIVMQGGKLNIDNSIISCKCDYSVWQGIQIQGNSSAHQWPDANGNYQQGRLVLNNATIENAIVAVDLWKDGDYSKTGGIVHATNSNFINNVRAVHALQYRNFHPVNYDEMAYNASFTNCTFEINADYPGHETFYKHVDLSQVNGLRFNGCDFSLSPDAQNVSDYNQAIAAYSAGFRVDAPCNDNYQPCSSYDHSTFNDFRVGIYAAGGLLSPYTYYINRAQFNGNTIGVLSNNVNNAIILNSEFHAAKNQYNWELCTYGIFIQAANGFTIEDNQFFKQAGAPLSNYIGIGVFDCNAIADVYRNEFTGLTAGNYAYGKNWDRWLYEGVEYLCNTNTENWADFYVTGNEEFHDNGIQSKQGAISLPARNTFSSSGATWHFYNETKNLVDYYFCQDCSGHYPEYVENVNRESVSTSGTCPSHYGSDTPERSVVMDATELFEAETAFAQSNYDYQGVKTLYNNLKDGGSTEEAIFDVSTAQPSQMWEIRSKLLGDSPYLSTEVLKLAADRTDMFTEAAIFDILAANPDELKKEELMKYLEEKENPLPDYMLNILKQVAEGTSYRTVLELQMSRHSHDRAQAANDIIRSILNADELDMDQLRLWLTNLGGLEAEKQLIASYVHQGDYSTALALAETLPVAYKLQDAQLLDHNQYMSLLQLQQNLKNSGRTMAQLTTAEQQQLTEIAESETASSSAMAKSVLELFYGTGFERCLPIAGEASYKSSAAADLNRLAEHYGMSLSAKPNPAGDWAAFDYTLPKGTETALLEITDAAGKTIATYTLQGRMGQQLTDTRNWPAGQYVYTLKAAGFTQSGKLVVK